MSTETERRVENLLDSSTVTENDNNVSGTSIQSAKQSPNVSDKNTGISDNAKKALNIELKERQEKQKEYERVKSMCLFREKLPAHKMKSEFLKAVSENQVLVVSGETGCGKTTQLPQFILEEEISSLRGSECNIICTQPRRISAISVAARIANERGENLGQSVGYQIRLESNRSEQTRLLFCTTGVLLRKLVQDPNLTGISHLLVSVFQKLYHQKEEVAKEFGIPDQFQRFWVWRRRQNLTYRPHHPLSPQEELQSVSQLKEPYIENNNAELNLFLEIKIGPDLKPLPLPEKTEDDILLFFKLYDPEKEELRFVGTSFVNKYDRPFGIIPKLKDIAGFSPDEEIDLYEEIRSDPDVMCEHVDKRVSFIASELQNGDIICFQKLHQALAVKKHRLHRLPDIPSFLEYVKNRQNRP